MQGHTFIGLIALIVLYHNGIEAKRCVICEHKTAHLSCGKDFIKVISASYGRSNRHTCSGGRSFSEVYNTQCHQQQSLRIMSERCNGLSSCAVRVINSVFSPDPCGLTYKYLDISYECYPAERSVTCEHKKSVISCAEGSLVIHHAAYGRRNLLTCPHHSVDYCYFSTDKLRRCNGEESCQLHVLNSVFTDPCPTVYKYLEVTYSCKTSCEE